MGYHDCITPPVIQRNVLENPGWYTQYTPYQAEIAQGRLEALLNFQTMVADLTGLPLANASLLDEATAAAEAMHMCHAARPRASATRFFVAEDCHPQTIAVVQTRAEPLGIEVARRATADASTSRRSELFGVLAPVPDDRRPRASTTRALVERAHARGRAGRGRDRPARADPAARRPGEFGADIAVGSAQRFGVPLGFGGPHAAFLATRDEYKRQMPGPHHRRLEGRRGPARATAWRCRRASSTSAARRRRATSAPRRCCWR